MNYSVNYQNKTKGNALKQWNYLMELLPLHHHGLFSFESINCLGNYEKGFPTKDFHSIGYLHNSMVPFSPNNKRWKYKHSIYTTYQLV